MGSSPGWLSLFPFSDARVSSFFLPIVPGRHNRVGDSLGSNKWDDRHILFDAEAWNTVCGGRCGNGTPPFLLQGHLSSRGHLGASKPFGLNFP